MSGHDRIKDNFRLRSWILHHVCELYLHKYEVIFVIIRVIGPFQKFSLFKYEKLKFYDLLNGSIELVFQKIQKWDL